MIELNIVMNVSEQETFASLCTPLSLCSLEILLDEKSIASVEIAEDALGDEVYYNHLKTSRKLTDETDLDEERV